MNERTDGRANVCLVVFENQMIRVFFLSFFFRLINFCLFVLLYLRKFFILLTFKVVVVDDKFEDGISQLSTSQLEAEKKTNNK